MSEEENKEEDIEKLYVDPDPKEMNVGGVTITYKELSGMEYNDVLTDLGVSGTDTDDFPQKEFMKEIIERCVVDPEDLDVERLKASYLIEIANKVQGGFGDIGESGIKNLNIE